MGRGLHGLGILLAFIAWLAHEAGPWLNRLGILLTFLAGFLVAPGLIGFDRLKNWERSVSGAIAEFVRGRWDLPMHAKMTVKSEILGTVRGVLAESGWYALASGAFYLCMWVGYTRSHWALLLAIGELSAACIVAWRRFHDASSKGARALFVFVDLVRIPLGIIYLLMHALLGAFYIFIFTLFVLSKRWLQHGGRLKRILVPMGIALFILGNLLQLIATFL